MWTSAYKGVVLALCCGVRAGVAQGELPALPTCIDRHMAKYDWMLEVHAATPLDDVMGGLWHAQEVTYCGTLGIVRCDRSDAPLPCQEALRAEQDALAQTVRAGLPDPADLEATTRAEHLYEAVYALAHGRSAGADCAGADEVVRVWCEAREASFRLRDAVLAWQVAQFLGRVPRAVEAGWAKAPPPVRPRARSAVDQ
ncbi:MAG: hypothetical protein ACRBCL_09330 [Maritimibacter sp.]